MSGLLSYSGLTTKIRAMQSHLLNDQNFREIVELESVPSAVSYLKQQKAYATLFDGCDESMLHRGQIEKMLRLTVYRDFSKLYRFSNVKQRKFLELYFKRYEISILKECLNTVFDHRDVVLNLSIYEEFFNRHSQLNISLLAASKTIEELIANLKGTEYYAPLERLNTIERPTLFDYEMTLDLYYFVQMWKDKSNVVTGSDLEELTRAWGSKFDMLNLQWIYRSKRYYHMTSADIYALLIPVQYRLDKKTIRALVEAENMSAFSQTLEQTYYAKRYDSFTSETLESMYAAIMKQILSGESRRDPYSVATIYSYLYHKEHEVNRLIIALECVRYRLTPEEAMQHVAKT
ncbi:MAG: V0D/AC39 family V-type ATPase subunit [Fusicatenibacter sp.]|nr:V-type ATPase subunit [Fusicatenibacter sp.]